MNPIIQQMLINEERKKLLANMGNRNSTTPMPIPKQPQHPVSNKLAQSMAIKDDYDDDEMSIEYIIENKPSTKDVREFFKDNLEELEMELS